MLLGCIADDFTGATDLANMLVREGMRTVQTIGIPAADSEVAQTVARDADAVVVALKSRTIPAEDAIAQSLEALAWLQSIGCEQIYFKYCSTFDSTAKGNIGPVADALMKALNTSFTIACPAFPENGRTVFRGYLFAGDMLLSESGMKDHPLTPMTDANLVRVLQAQTPGKVGLVKYDTVARGCEAIRTAFDTLIADGTHAAIVDAISNDDLYAIGEACANLPLVTGGSGIALGLPQNFRKRGLLHNAGTAAALPPLSGHAAVVAGSCSVATNAQVAQWKQSRPAFFIDAFALADGKPVVKEALAWANERIATEPVLIYATSAPADVKAVQAKLGVERAGQLVEDALAEIARGLIDQGVTKLVAAGGETSGAVVQALSVGALKIGPQIDPGVPWTLALGEREVALALKSGNFGSVDFFEKALRQLGAIA